VTAATIELLKPYKNGLFTITTDKEKEFTGHEKIAEEFDLNVYFAHPYSSSEPMRILRVLFGNTFLKAVVLRKLPKMRLKRSHIASIIALEKH